jgi:leader peptidase (prepilin peptidase)/N-methyltransferase
VIAFSALSGAIVGSALIISGRKSRQSPIPYGPFLAGAAVLVLLWGDRLWGMYLRFVGWY